MSELVGSADHLLTDLYACPLDPAKWQSTLDRISHRTGAHSAVVQLLSPDGHWMRQRWLARDSLSTTNAAAHDAHLDQAQNPRLDMRMRMGRPTGHVVRDSDIFAADCPRQRRLKSQLAEIGLGNYAGIGSELSDGRYLSLVLHRSIDDPCDFDRADEAFMIEIMPHIAQSFHLSEAMGRIGAESAVLNRLVDRFETGVLLCDASMGVRWSNRLAERMIDDSALIAVSDGRLRARRPETMRRIEALIAAALAGRRSDPVVIGDAGSEDALHLVAATPGSLDIDDLASAITGPSVALTLSRAHSTPRLSAEAVQILFGVAPAEARLTVALCGGLSLDDYAQSRGVSIGTVRTQLKRVLAKTDTRRQSELVARVSNCFAARLCSY